MVESNPIRTHRKSAFSGNDFSRLSRTTAQIVAYLILKPLLILVDKIGLSGPLWRTVGREMREDVVEGSDFGDYRPGKNDVFICTYPKCGTNWAMQIAHQIATRGTGEFVHIHDVVPWPDFTRQDIILPIEDDSIRAASATGLRVIKTHLEWERIPYSSDARYICILRNPKDAFVSNYYFVRDIFFGPVMPSVDVWLDLFCSDGFPFIWPDHVNGYWAARDLSNVMILTFEELKADMPAAISKMAQFVGVELGDEELARVAEKSAFGYMQNIGYKFDPPAITPLASSDRKMIRRGASGSSGELLNTLQQRKIDDWTRARLADLGGAVPYDEIWG
tara:strand:- start:1128 stop:2129 length:1002 start_codon:yes stop_codon:yes gene_type:complete